MSDEGDTEIAIGVLKLPPPQVIGKVEDQVAASASVCGGQVALELPPGVFDVLRVGACFGIDEVVAVIDCEVMLVVTIELIISFPAVGYYSVVSVDVLFNYVY